MKIDEIPLDASLELEISKDDRMARVSAEIERVLDKALVLKPIRVDEKLLNMEDADVNVLLLYKRAGQKPLIWRNITYAPYRQGNYPIIVVGDKRDGVEHNRRTSFRLDMDVPGTLNKSEKVIIHDISGTGISFYISGENSMEVGESFRIGFTGGYENITVSGTVVRKDDGGERVLYGGTIKGNPYVNRFISEEQSRRARKR